MAGKKKKKAKRDLTHADIMAAAAKGDPKLLRRSELLWEDRARPTRGPKPGLTPAEVVETAMAIADAEGLAAVSMHAVAARLGFTTMALYRYFPSREALYDAIIDAGMGEPPRPARGGGGGWRAVVTELARAKRAMLIARPWLAELPFVAAPHGPNWLLWHEAVVQAFGATGLKPVEQAQMLNVVDGYVRGASDTAVSLARARARGISEEEWAAGVGTDLGRALGDPRFPGFAAIITTASDEPPKTLEGTFDFGLQVVLDGIETYIGERAGV